MSAGGIDDGAEFAGAFLVGEDGVEELAFVEFGPRGVGDDEFGVGGLPDKEIAPAHLAGGADHEVRLGVLGVVEVLGDSVFRDRFGGDAFGDHRFDGVDDFGSTAVVHRQGKRDAGVVLGEVDSVLERLLEGFGHFVGSAGNLDFHVFFVHSLKLVAGGLLDEPHEALDFVIGATPVFDGESVDREVADTKVAGDFDRVLEGFVSGPVAEESPKSASVRPPSVAIHDDGYMFRQSIEIDSLGDGALLDRKHFSG